MNDKSLPTAVYWDGNHQWSVDNVTPNDLWPLVTCPICGSEVISYRYQYPERQDNRLTGGNVMTICIALGVIAAIVICLYMDSKGMLK